MVDVVKDVVNTTWTPGIQREDRISEGHVELKLKGNPWRGSGLESVESRRILAKVIDRMAAIRFG